MPDPVPDFSSCVRTVLSGGPIQSAQVASLPEQKMGFYWASFHQSSGREGSPASYTLRYHQQAPGEAFINAVAGLRGCSSLQWLSVLVFNAEAALDGLLQTFGLRGGLVLGLSNTTITAKLPQPETARNPDRRDWSTSITSPAAIPSA